MFSSGDAGDHEVNLRHDGEVHLPLCARWSALRTRGQVLPGSNTQISTNTVLQDLFWEHYKVLYKCSNVSFLSVLFLLQKMDKNRDGVVTIEEFIETCQKVTVSTRTDRQTLKTTSVTHQHKQCSTSQSSVSVTQWCHWLNRRWLRLSSFALHKTSPMFSPHFSQLPPESRPPSSYHTLLILNTTVWSHKYYHFLFVTLDIHAIITDKLMWVISL